MHLTNWQMLHSKTLLLPCQELIHSHNANEGRGVGKASHAGTQEEGACPQGRRGV